MVDAYQEVENRVVYLAQPGARAEADRTHRHRQLEAGRGGPAPNPMSVSSAPWSRRMRQPPASACRETLTCGIGRLLVLGLVVGSW